MTDCRQFKKDRPVRESKKDDRSDEWTGLQASRQDGWQGPSSPGP